MAASVSATVRHRPGEFSLSRLSSLSGPRRGVLLTALAVTAGLVLSACSSDSTAANSSSSSSSASSSSSSAATSATGSSAAAETSADSSAGTSASEGSFPVTITHAFGETVIPAAPERVLTISWQNQDVVLALGVDPIAIPKVTYGNDDKGMYPWFTEALGDKPVPELLDEATGLSFEAISDAKPDLILGVYSGLSAEDYATLAGIAPTVAYPEAAYATDWTDTTTIIGQALGKEAEAAKLIADTTAYIADKGAEFPQLAGKTFAYAAFPNDTELNLYTPTDARVSLLTGLGLQVAPSVTELSTGATSFFVPVAFEQLDTIQSDILILIADDEAQKTALLANPFIAALPQVSSGAYAVLVGQQFVMSASAPSVLSIPWGFDQFVPELAAAADKVG